MNLDELQKLCDEATPGPWSDPMTMRSMIWPTANDARFIAEFRNHARALLNVARAADDMVPYLSVHGWDGCALFVALAALKGEK